MHRSVDGEPRCSQSYTTLSRASAAHEMTSDFIAQGVRVEAPAYDAADLISLQMKMTAGAKMLPPEKGCMQVSGAVLDTWFEKIYFEYRTAVTRLKVQIS